jgi:hypothetical protein
VRELLANEGSFKRAQEVLTPYSRVRYSTLHYCTVRYSTPRCRLQIKGRFPHKALKMHVSVSVSVRVLECMLDAISVRVT